LSTPSEIAAARQRLRDVGYSPPWDKADHGETNIARDRVDAVKERTLSNNTQTILPPIDGADSLLGRVRSVAGQPERNMEDVVKDLLIRLGHSPHRIIFQRGRVDLILHDGSGRVAAVFEVK